MRDPFRLLTTRRAIVALAALAAPTLACVRAFTPLRTPAAPRGIVSLELARTPEDAEAVMRSWRERGLVPAARRDVRIDFLFLVLYSTWLALLLSLSARAAVASGLVGRRRGETAGAIGAWGMWAAAALDAVENVALLRMLGGRIDRPTVATASAAARGKFALVVTGPLASSAALAAAAIRARR